MYAALSHGVTKNSGKDRKSVIEKLMKFKKIWETVESLSKIWELHIYGESYIAVWNRI